MQVRLPRVERAVVPNHVKERNIFLECGFVSLFDVLVDIEVCLSTRKHNHVSSLCKNSKALGGNVLPEHTLSVSQNELLEESETHNFQF